MANTLSSIGSSSQTTTEASANSAGLSNDKLASKDTFLKLMVAQLKYQNPLSPVDGSAFLAQLSQMSSVEQMVAMRQDLDSMLKIFGGTTTDTTTGTGSSASSGSSIES